MKPRVLARRVRTWTLVLCLLVSAALSAQQTTASEKLVNYLSKNSAQFKLQPADASQLQVISSYVDAASGIEHIYAQQQVNGIDVVGSVFSLHSSKGEKQVAANNLIPVSGYSKPGASAALSAEQGARKALLESGHAANTPLTVKESSGNKVVFKRGEATTMDIPVRKVYLPNEKTKSLALAWEVQLFDAGGQHYWVMYVDAHTGAVLKKQDAIIRCTFNSPHFETDEHMHLPADLAQVMAAHNKNTLHNTNSTKNFSPFATANSYKVFPDPIEAPHDGDHQVSVTAGNSFASPDGWHRIAAGPPQPYTWGNNVFAFHDPAPAPLGGVPNQATSAPASSTTPGTIEPMVFNYALDTTIEPESPNNLFSNRMAAIVNLFYWNNLMHDVYYQFGFTESARNFQQSHLFTTGLRGSGAGEGDPVWAQAQDGGGTNNANMLTLADGAPGSAQMQMYLWTTASPDSLVQIVTSTFNPPPPGKKYIAIQGSFAQPTGANNLHTSPTPVTQLVIAQKNPLSTVGDSTQGCSTGQQSIALPTPGVSGRIAVIDRGSCSFVEKVLGAQLGGAVGVIIVNNVPGPPISMGGADAPGNLITIPAVMVSKDDGEVIKMAIRNGLVTGQLKRDNPPKPKRDGDFDNAVIAHEYGHGISNRLTGSGILPLYGNEQGGEGWSDFMGLYMITRTSDLLPANAAHPNGILPEKGLGTYLVYEPKTGKGIRPTRYSVTTTPQFTFKDINNPVITIPHGVGYIWCQMLYSMQQEMINMYGFNDDIYNPATPTTIPGNPPAGAGGNNVAMRLIMEGMKLQPEGPTFEQQRDAILDADTLLYNGVNSCAIWKAFAKFGLGFSAKSNSRSVGDEVEAYDMPPACLANQVNITLDLKSPTRAISGSNITDSIRVKNVFNTALNHVLVVDTLPAQSILVSTNPAASSVTNVGGRTVVKWNTTLAGLESKLFTVTSNINIPSAGNQLYFDDHEDGAGGWTTLSTNPTEDWSIKSTKPFSGNNHWYVENIDPNIPASDHYLQMSSDVAIPAGGAELVFTHLYNTELAFDGGSVEISNNGGATWTYLPNTKFVRNGYNAIIPATNTPNFTNQLAFSGSSGGYITSIADLSDYAGQTIRVRFRFVQDVGTRVDGWYVDDVYIMTNRTEIRNAALARVGSDASFSTVLDEEIDSALTFVFGTLAPLPVTAAELKARTSNDRILLDWFTTDEKDLAFFEIERQAQNERKFVTIATEKAKGNTNGRTPYSSFDFTVKPDILYSYRVKLVQQDGSFRYTNVVTAKIGNGKSFGFTLMPNPASNNVRLSFNNQPSANARLRVYEVGGKLLTTLNVGIVNSVSTNLDVTSFQNGVYWLELEDNGLKQTQRMVIQR